MGADRRNGIKNHILYGTLARSVYQDVLPLLSQENNSTMQGLSLITVVFGALLSGLSAAGVLSRHVLPAYLFLLLTSVAFIIVRRALKSPGVHVRGALGGVQCVVLLVFGILNSAVFSPSPESNGTIFNVLLLVVPFLFTDIPCRMDPLLAVVSAAYCVIIRKYKVPAVVSLDTVNTVFVCLISCMCNWIFGARNMKNLANRLYIEKERDTDSLTGLLTKHSARVITTAELAHGCRGVFAIIDLDDFKHVNDTYGHLYGDEVLVKVARCIRENTRRSDVAARFGGDEFTVFFPEMDAQVVERKMSDFFSSMQAAFRSEKAQVTCSVGITEVAGLADYDSLFNAADRALYESKRMGKNRFIVAKPGDSVPPPYVRRTECDGVG